MREKKKKKKKKTDQFLTILTWIKKKININNNNKFKIIIMYPRISEIPTE